VPLHQLQGAAAFASLAQKRADALVVAADTMFTSRRVSAT
jgi:hypothetical protein